MRAVLRLSVSAWTGRAAARRRSKVMRVRKDMHAAKDARRSGMVAVWCSK